MEGLGNLEDLDSLREAARYRAAYKNLRSWAQAGIAVVPFWFYIVVKYPRYELEWVPELAVSAIVFVGAVAAYISVRSRAHLVFALALVMMGLAALGRAVAEMFSATIHPPLALAEAGFGLFWLYYGIKEAESKEYAALDKPPPPVTQMRELDCLAKEIKSKCESDGEKYVEARVWALPTSRTIGKLTPQVAVFVDEWGIKIRFARPGELDVELRRMGFLTDKRWVRMTIADEKFTCTMSQTSYGRILAWKERAEAGASRTQEQQST